MWKSRLNVFHLSHNDVVKWSVTWWLGFPHLKLLPFNIGGSRSYRKEVVMFPILTLVPIPMFTSGLLSFIQSLIILKNQLVKREENCLILNYTQIS